MLILRDNGRFPKYCHISHREFVDTETSIRDLRESTIVTWIAFLVGIFQTKFCVTDRAIQWLLLFIVAIFKEFSFFSKELVKYPKLTSNTVYA